MGTSGFCTVNGKTTRCGKEARGNESVRPAAVEWLGSRPSDLVEAPAMPSCPASAQAAGFKSAPARWSLSCCPPAAWRRCRCRSLQVQCGVRAGADWAWRLPGRIHGMVHWVQGSLRSRAGKARQALVSRAHGQQLRRGPGVPLNPGLPCVALPARLQCCPWLWMRSQRTEWRCQADPRWGRCCCPRLSRGGEAGRQVGRATRSKVMAQLDMTRSGV